MLNKLHLNIFYIHTQLLSCDCLNICGTHCVGWVWLHRPCCPFTLACELIWHVFTNDTSWLWGWQSACPCWVEWNILQIYLHGCPPACSPLLLCSLQLRHRGPSDLHNSNNKIILTVQDFSKLSKMHPLLQQTNIYCNKPAPRISLPFSPFKGTWHCYLTRFKTQTFWNWLSTGPGIYFSAW